MDNIEEILIAYFNDDLTSSGKHEVDVWIEKSSENKRIFQETKKVYELSNLESGKFCPDVKAAWICVSNKINIPNRSKSNHVAMWYKIAAVLLLGVGIGFASYYELTKEVFLAVNTGANETYRIELIDGSKIVLNENTTFKYPKEFGDENRRVFLNGQAFFEVNRDESKPFKIVGRSTVVTVLGTSFDLNSTKSYTDLNVVSGKVEIKDKASHQKEIVIKNQRAIVENDEIQLVNELDESRIAWRRADLNFKSTPVSEVAIILENHFKVKIEVDEQIKNCLITSKMSSMELDEILQVLTIIADIKSESKSDVIELTGPSC